MIKIYTKMKMLVNFFNKNPIAINIVAFIFSFLLVYFLASFVINKIEESNNNKYIEEVNEYKKVVEELNKEKEEADQEILNLTSEREKIHSKIDKLEADLYKKAKPRTTPLTLQEIDEFFDKRGF